jgi:hypothetical protein
LNGSFQIESNYNFLGWTLISNSNPDFVIGPPTSGTANSETTTNVPVTITEAVAGSYTTSVVIHDSNGRTYTLVITATFVDPTATLIANPTSVTFPKNVLGTTPAMVTVALSNNTGGPIVVSGFTAVGLPFSCTTAVPFTIADTTSTNITLQATYDVVGSFLGSITVHSSGLDLVIPVSVMVVFLFSVNVLLNTSSAILLGFLNSTEQFDGSTFNPAIDSVLIFNGSLWNSPGNEKTLARMEVYYENVGVCTGLKLDISVWRPSDNAYDTQSKTITIGDVSADLSERSAYFDVNMSGELIVIQLTRLASSGPVSLLGFVPWFSDRGEKVGDV